MIGSEVPSNFGILGALQSSKKVVARIRAINGLADSLSLAVSPAPNSLRAVPLDREAFGYLEVCRPLRESLDGNLLAVLGQRFVLDLELWVVGA